MKKKGRKYNRTIMKFGDRYFALYLHNMAKLRNSPAIFLKLFMADMFID